MRRSEWCDEASRRPPPAPLGRGLPFVQLLRLTSCRHAGIESSCLTRRRVSTAQEDAELDHIHVTFLTVCCYHCSFISYFQPPPVPGL